MIGQEWSSGIVGRRKRTPRQRPLGVKENGSIRGGEETLGTGLHAEGLGRITVVVQESLKFAATLSQLFWGAGGEVLERFSYSMG